MLHKNKNKLSPSITPTYASRAINNPIPRSKLPSEGTIPTTAYRIIKDELALDGNAHMNLATFVTTWMEPEANQLMAETMDKNLIDKDEYPQTAAIERRCVHILADLWHSKDPVNGVGTSTVGSSEACMLAGMAMKWRWRQKNNKSAGDSQRPNIVMGINVQVCWDKFCKYWDIEPRLAPMEKRSYHLEPKAVAELCDENTIGVVAIMGSTFDGSYEPVKHIAHELDKIQKQKGWDIPIHVDAASGGFVAPFIQPKLEWDFRLPRVVSINTSGHKYGMVYPGVGWVVWRDQEHLPDDLVFYVNYLGGKMPTFAINFSKPGNGVIAQYYNFLRLGKKGYTEIQQRCHDTATMLSAKIEGTKKFDMLTRGEELPVFAFKLKDNITNYTVYDISDKLRERGWQVPAYSLPKHLEDVSVLRIVVKENFSVDMADMLFGELQDIIKELEEAPCKTTSSHKTAFHH